MNKNLIVVLVVLAIIVLGYWGCRWYSARTDKVEAMPTVTEYRLYCLGREDPFIYTDKAEADALEKQDGKVKNPETGEFNCQWGSRPLPEGMMAP